MTLARTALSLVAVAITLAVVAPLPASAGTQVFSAKMVCAEVIRSIPSAVQTAGTGTGSLATTAADVQVKIALSNLPASSPVACFVACVVDGDLELFNIQRYVPCGMTSAAGKFNFTNTFLLSDIDGGCLVPLIATVTIPEESPAVVCAPGFGSFEPFDVPPPVD